MAVQQRKPRRKHKKDGNVISIVDKDGEIFVDAFAGGGGASTGIRAAIGREVDIAINHSPLAIAMHATNHPHADHYIEDVFAVDPIEACCGRRPKAMWMSPDCTHFSRAKGGKPRNKKIRALAWLAVRWARAVKPEIIFIENVPEFKTWGPLDNDGQPIKEKAGKTFRLWLNKLRGLGYVVEWKELLAANYGAPTTRKRLFIVARCDGKPIVWPEETHGKDKDKPWRSAAECIDWSVPCPSIFGRKKPLAKATLERIAAGLRRFVFSSPRPFVVPLTHHGSAERVYDSKDPFPTITAAHRGEMALISAQLASPHLMTNTTGHAGRSVEEPIPTQTTGVHHYVINPILEEIEPKQQTEQEKTAPFLATVTHTKSGHLVHDIEDPIKTVTTANGGEFILVTPVLSSQYGESVGRKVTDPLPTVTSDGGGDQAIVTANLIQVGYGERKEVDPEKSQKPRVMDIEKPLTTIVGGGGKHGIVQATFLSKAFGGGKEKMSPGSNSSEPVGTITSKDHNHLVAVTMTQFYGSNKVGADIEEPMPTVTAQGQHTAVVSARLEPTQESTQLAHITKFRNGSIGTSLEDPLPTVTANGFVKRPGGAVPLGVVTASVEPVGKKKRGKKSDKSSSVFTDRRDEVHAFLRRHADNVANQSAKRRGKSKTKELPVENDCFSLGVVVVDGVEHQIVDIGMRMLQPEELFRAQGFPEDYRIDVEVVKKGKIKKLTKTELIALCGNAVCPPVAEALVRANYFSGESK